MAAIDERLPLGRKMDATSDCDSLTSGHVTPVEASQNSVPYFVSNDVSLWAVPSGVHSQTTGHLVRNMLPALGGTEVKPLVPVNIPPSTHIVTPHSVSVAMSVSTKSCRRASNPMFLSSLMQVDCPVGQERGHVSSPVSLGRDSVIAAVAGRSPFTCVPNWPSVLSARPSGHYSTITPGYHCSPLDWESTHKMAPPLPPLSSVVNTRSMPVSHDRPLDLSRSSVKQETLCDDAVVKSPKHDCTVKSSKCDSYDSEEHAQVVNIDKVLSPPTSVSSRERTFCQDDNSALLVQRRGQSLDVDVQRPRLYTPVATFPPLAAASVVSSCTPLTLAVTHADTAPFVSAHSATTTKSAFQTVKMSPVPSTQLTPPGGMNIRMKEMLVYENRLLQMEFHELIASGNSGVVMATGSSVLHLQRLYQESVDGMETERFQTLRECGSEAQRELVNSHYDQVRLLLLRDNRCMLRGETTPQMSASVKPQSLPTTPTAVSMATVGDAHNIRPFVERNNVNRLCPVELTSPDYFIGRGTKRKYLHQGAVCVLNEWYEQHFDHPYPEDDAVDVLATRAAVSASQVKKWMANKRVRSCNTLAFNGSIHPKKLQKLLQLKDCPLTTPPEPPSEIKTPTSLEKHARSKRMLDPAAVCFMNQWYYDHQAYPYPTEEEKRCIAGATGVTVAQVTCWFANKRNRSHNTRKLSAALMLQKLNRKLHIYHSMQRNRLSTVTSCDNVPSSVTTCEMAASQTLTQVK